MVQSRLGGASYEVEYATKLIEAIRVGGLFGADELNFAVDLIRSIGPNGRRAPYYRAYFSKLANTLLRLRTELGVENPD